MNSSIDRIIVAFKEVFKKEPSVFLSPGRINLIGEHTDYNQGFVLPAAINKAITIAIAPNHSNAIRLYSVDMDSDYQEYEISTTYNKTGIEWADYIIGVVCELENNGSRIGGFDCAFGGNVPIGAGLSSSAALGGGITFALSKLFDLNLSLLQMAQTAQMAENNFVGVQCGIMDPFASLHGRYDQVIKLDCRSLEYEYYPFKWTDISVLLCDSNVRRSLAGSAYNKRRKQCEQGVQEIRKTNPTIESLRDVTPELLRENKDLLDPVVYRRCSFVIEENKRVDQACTALLNEDLVRFGELMYLSHNGLRDKYEVSCNELDLLVDATHSLDGVLGSRMMGGGFGGCTINLVQKEAINDCTTYISKQYEKEIGKEPTFHVVQISNGTYSFDYPSN